MLDNGKGPLSMHVSAFSRCAYCAKEKGTTRDHVISKNLFPTSYPKKNLITVPSCIECNRRFSLDEERFRNFVCNLAVEHSNTASELFFSKMKRSIQRNPGIGHSMLNQMETVYAPDETGRLKEQVKINISDQDWKRYCNVLDKYIRGLFFHEFKKTLPNHYRVHHSFGNDRLEENLKDIQLRNVDNSAVIAYGYSRIKHTSIWAMVFYRSILFMTVVCNEEDFQKIKAR